MEGNYLIDVGDKRIKIRCVIFQSLVYNSCNASYVTHDHTPKNLDGEVD
jgi:hypothetical protein